MAQIPGGKHRKTQNSASEIEKQLHRGRVLVVRIQFPPAASHANHRFLSGGARIVEKLSPIVTGYVAAATGSFNTAFVLSAK